MDDDELYGLLQNLTSPVVAITTATEDDTNGMIANSAIRASLVPDCPRVAFYCFKSHYSHELLSTSGHFCLHLLQRQQLEVVRALGFESGRKTDKLADVSHRYSERGLPVIDGVYAHFECRVVNAMDAGPSTFFMGDVLAAGKHPDASELTLLDSDYFRENMPEEWKDDYRENKKSAQTWAKDHLEVDPTYNWTN